MEEHLRSRVSQGALASDLVESAEDALRFWKIILPPASTLERLAASVAATGRQEILERIATHLADSTRKSLDALLEVAKGERHSGLMIFKEYPPEASPAAILDYVERYRLLQQTGVSGIDLTAIPSAIVDHLAQLARKYDAQALKRFDAAARYAMLACFLVEAQKSLLDHLATMHDQFVTGISRRSRNAFEERHREFRKRAKRGVQTLLAAIEILLDRSQPDPLAQLQQTIDDPTLHSALADCREFQRLEENGYQEELRLRHSHLRRYLPAFLTLPFQAEPGTQSCCEPLSWRAGSMKPGTVLCRSTPRTTSFRPLGGTPINNPMADWINASGTLPWRCRCETRSGPAICFSPPAAIMSLSPIWSMTSTAGARRGPAHTNSSPSSKRPMRCWRTSAGNLMRWPATPIAE